MGYTSKQFSGHKGIDRDGNVTREELFRLVEFLENELAQVSRAFQETQELELRLTGKVPKRPKEGMIVAADGNGWNPGSGKGIYAYLSGEWIQLGGLGVNSKNNPYYVVDVEAHAMLQDLVIESKVQSLILQTKLNFKVDLDKVRSMYFETK